jgi:capsular polysaccharide biosynthesis protein
MVLRSSLEKRLAYAAAARGLVASDAAPTGVTRSLRDWTFKHHVHCGAAWISSPLSPEPPLGDPETVSPAATVGFQNALEYFQTQSPTMVADALDIAVLPDARLVTVDGLVITHDGLLASESAWDDDKLRASGVLRARRMPRAPVVLGSHATLISQWCQAYYHWMTDVLPRLAVLEGAGCADVALIVPQNLAVWQQRSLELLGMADRLTPYGGSLRPEVLVWPRPAAIPGHTPRWACAWVRERLGPGTASGRRRRLYLTRRGERQRRVANEGDVWAKLAPMGFEMIDAGKLSLDQQIEVFADAAVVVSPHGGALTNILFARDAVVVELFEASCVNPCYYALAARCEHQYWYLVGRRTDDGHIDVDVAQLAQTLAAAGLDSPMG